MAHPRSCRGVIHRDGSTTREAQVKRHCIAVQIEKGTKMKRSMYAKVLLIVVLAFASMTLTGCIIKPYEVEEFVEVSPSQTAFAIPLEGDMEEQAMFQSEQFLEEHMVAVKRVPISHRWHKTGRMPGTGEWIDTVRVIVVERKPATREWTQNTETGTDVKNQGIVAESMESISFIVPFNCTAQINETDTVRFLYQYHDRPLEEIIDLEIRNKVEALFIEECSKYTLDELLGFVDSETGVKTEGMKAQIVQSVREEVTNYFKERGITITVLGLAGDFEYPDPEVQDAINDVFAANRELQAQRDRNERTRDTAEAEAYAANQLQSAAGGVDYQIRKLELENQAAWIDAWNGELPQVAADSGVLLEMTPEN